MKVKIIKTGEIVEVVPSGIYFGQVEDAYSKRHWSFNEIEIIPNNIKQENIIDWEQRRFELVKAVLQGWVASEDDRQYTIQEVIDIIFPLADAIIVKLKENN